MPIPRILSYGAGLDSFRMLVEAVQRNYRLDGLVFIDVTDSDEEDPGEWPATYEHIRSVVLPLCAAHGIPFHWVDSKSYPIRGARSLYAWMMARKQIPVAGPKRLCTIIAKVERFEAWLDDHYPDQEVEVWVGFEAGEEARAAKDPNAGTDRKVKPGQAIRANRFPLMEWGLCRCLCDSLCRAEGLQVPPGSACMFCPYATKGDWQRLHRDLPHRFEQAAVMEAQKPPTAAGFKLSIMGFRKKKHPVTKEVLSYRAPMLATFIQGTYRPRQEPCGVCGAAVKLKKAVGCETRGAV